jgi:hypothetical protein
MKIGNKMFPLVMASVLIGTVAATNLQQQATAFTDPWLKNFKKLTHEFEKAVIQAVGNPDTTPADIREMHKVWEDGVLKIFPPDPAILRLLEDYQQDVATLMDFYFDGELQQHDLIKQFKQLTRTFRTEVLDLAHQGFSEGPR